MVDVWMHELYSNLALYFITEQQFILHDPVPILLCIWSNRAVIGTPFGWEIEMGSLERKSVMKFSEKQYYFLYICYALPQEFSDCL
jgi:hypothetical protein